MISAGSGLTVEDLEKDKNLTPESFARHFVNFGFCFRKDVQPPEQFLSRRSGDCDDYAILAAGVFRARGYRPRLITVRTKKIVHVVCYVPETGSYLDYNQRRSPQKTVPSDGSLADVARRVACSFNDDWTSVSEFTFESGRKRLVKTITPDSLIDSGKRGLIRLDLQRNSSVGESG